MSRESQRTAAGWSGVNESALTPLRARGVGCRAKRPTPRKEASWRNLRRKRPSWTRRSFLQTVGVTRPHPLARPRACRERRTGLSARSLREVHARRPRPLLQRLVARPRPARAGPPAGRRDRGRRPPPHPRGAADAAGAAVPSRPRQPGREALGPAEHAARPSVPRGASRCPSVSRPASSAWRRSASGTRARARGAPGTRGSGWGRRWPRSCSSTTTDARRACRSAAASRCTPRPTPGGGWPLPLGRTGWTLRAALTDPLSQGTDWGELQTAVADNAYSFGRPRHALDLGPGQPPARAAAAGPPAGGPVRGRGRALRPDALPRAGEPPAVRAPVPLPADPAGAGGRAGTVAARDRPRHRRAHVLAEGVLPRGLAAGPGRRSRRAGGAARLPRALRRDHREPRGDARRERHAVSASGSSSTWPASSRAARSRPAPGTPGSRWSSASGSSCAGGSSMPPPSGRPPRGSRFARARAATSRPTGTGARSTPAGSRTTGRTSRSGTPRSPTWTGRSRSSCRWGRSTSS